MSAYVLTTNARTSVVLKKGAQNPSCCDSYVFCPGREVQASLHSRRQHHRVGVIHENPEMFDWVKRAWAVWVLANGSYGGKVDGSFGYDRTGSVSKKLANKRASFAEGCAIRLQRAQIESCDALRIIGSRDAQDAFFYLDPPYVRDGSGPLRRLRAGGLRRFFAEAGGRAGKVPAKLISKCEPARVFLAERLAYR